jgi:hypothetical protein
VAATSRRSFPRVSDGNAFGEALFRTAKYGPEFAAKGFADLQQGRHRALDFVIWYNHDHRTVAYATSALCIVMTVRT